MTAFTTSLLVVGIFALVFFGYQWQVSLESQRKDAETAEAELPESV